MLSRQLLTKKTIKNCIFQIVFAGLAIAGILGAAGCGQTGAPAAPSLALPAPVTDLASVRKADRVQLSWTMPRRTLDKLPLRGPQSIRICRYVESAPCVMVPAPRFTAGKPAIYEDMLPSVLTSGPPALVSYTIEVLSRHGRSAGTSNPAHTAAGTAPSPLEELNGHVTAGGVLFGWRPAVSPSGVQAIDIHRSLLSAPKINDAAKSALGDLGGPQPKEQTLAVHLPGEVDPGKALDPEAAFDLQYSYRLTRRTTVTLSGKSIEMLGPVSPAIVIATRDTFPPEAPTGLAAVASPSEKAIDLSWTPGSESDIAGYALYRHSDGEPAHRLSLPATPVDSPAYRDLTAQPGKVYTYTVTAIDRDGNESRPSAETTETLPAQP